MSILVGDLDSTDTRRPTNTYMQTGAVCGTDCMLNSCVEELLHSQTLPPDAVFDTRTHTRGSGAAASCHPRAPKPTAHTHTELTVSSMIFNL